MGHRETEQNNLAQVAFGTTFDQSTPAERETVARIFQYVNQSWQRQGEPVATHVAHLAAEASTASAAAAASASDPARRLCGRHCKGRDGVCIPL